MIETMSEQEKSGRRSAGRRVNIPAMLRLEQAERLRELARKEDLPCSVLIRRAVEKLLVEAGL